MRRLTRTDWVTLVVISTAFLFLFRGVPAPNSYLFGEANTFPGLELHPCLLTDDDAVILERAKAFGIQELLNTNSPNDPFPEKLKQIFPGEEKLSPRVTSAAPFRLESRV